MDKRGESYKNGWTRGMKGSNTPVRAGRADPWVPWGGRGQDNTLYGTPLYGTTTVSVSYLTFHIVYRAWRGEQETAGGGVNNLLSMTLVEHLAWRAMTSC